MKIWEKGLAVRQRQALERAKAAQSLHRQGMSISGIAKRLGVANRTISKDLKKDLTLLINNPEIVG